MVELQKSRQQIYRLTKLYKTVELPDNAATAGALRKVAPYVKVEEI